MVMAVFALGTILFAWATSSFGAYQGGAGVWFMNRGEAMKERLVIEQVSFTSAFTPSLNELMIIYVRNVGTIDCNVVAIYVNSSSAPSQKVIGSGGYQMPISLKVGSVTSINVTLTGGWLGPWHSGSVSTIGVATARGNVVSGTWKA